MAPTISIFSFDVPVYGICWFLGIAFSGILGILFCKKAKIEKYDVVYSAVFSVIGGTVGAKLLFIIVSLKTIIENNIPFENLLKGGFVFYGGLIGGFLGLLVYTKAFKLQLLPFCDIYALALPLGHAVGRVGCYISGCCYGCEYDGPFAVTYTQTLGNTPLGVKLFPLQLAESVLLLLLSVAIGLLFLRRYKKGVLCAIYLLSYSVLRFVLEFFRGDLERGTLFGLSTSQIISIAVFISGIIVILHIKNEPHNSGSFFMLP